MPHMSHHCLGQFHQNNIFCRMCVTAGNSCFIGRTICVWSTAFCFQPFITCTCAPRHLSNQFNRTIKQRQFDEWGKLAIFMYRHSLFLSETWKVNIFRLADFHVQKISEDSVTNVNSSQVIWKTGWQKLHAFGEIWTSERLFGAPRQWCFFLNSFEGRKIN